MAANEVAKLLRAIADIIERSDPDQVKAIANILADAPRKAQRSSNIKNASYPRLSLDQFLSKFDAASSREEGQAILDSLNLTKRELLMIGRELNVHILKEDSLHFMEEKIIEALIGARLNSKAIRGDS